MTVYIGERWDQPILWFESQGVNASGAPGPVGILAVCQGIGVLDFSELQYNEGDWTRDPLVFSVACGFKPKFASVSVFPQAFDVGVAPNSPTDVGWGIDNAFATDLQDNGAEVTATLVLKTMSAEMLRVGWTVVFVN